MQRFKEMLATGELVRTFALGRFCSSVAIDMFALAGGYHGFWLDQEHVGLSCADIQTASLAARANHFDFFVRMAPVGYWAVTQNLEAGAGGVMCARCDSAAQAEEFVRWAKFAPRGMRGLNTSGRDALYTFKPLVDFTVEANREHFTAIQIETLGALDDVDQIAAIDGVDLLFVGPSDLTQALGILGQWDVPRLTAALEAVANACRRHGKSWGSVTPTPEYTRRCYDLGCRMLTFAGDMGVIRQGIEATRAPFADYF